MSRGNYILLTAVFATSVGAWILSRSCLLPPHGPLQFLRGFPGSDEKITPQLAVLAYSLRLVEDNYVHELDKDDRQRLLEHAIEAALQSLDEHSSYISPQEYLRFRELEQGHFGGIGVQISQHPLTNQLIVQSPIPNTPAFRAGLQNGDVIVAVNQESVSNIEEAISRIKGPPGTKVQLTIRPWGQSDTRVVEVERADIPIESVLGVERSPEGQWNFWLDKSLGLGYVRLEAFNPTSSQELYNVLTLLRQQALRGLVLDLRGNPGGRLETAIEVAELFLPKDSPIVTVHGRRRSLETYRTGKVRESLWQRLNLEPGVFLDLPLVVLIDAQSASASEILASALQDNHRATLIGQRTFGKASVQTVFPLPPSNHALKLTTAEYLRPSGKNIHRFRTAKDTDIWGVTPDVLIPLSSEEQQQLLLSQRLRDLLWRTQHLRHMQERFDLSTALLGSSATTIDPDNFLYIRTRWASAETDPVLERACAILRQSLERK